MINPWKNLTRTEPHILDSDKNEILKFNNKYKDKYAIRLELLPGPFSGNSRANIILLTLNPGYRKGEEKIHRDDKSFIRLCRNTLIHAKSKYPFYQLNPKMKDKPGHNYWTKKLKPLIDSCGLEKVANNVCCIEFFPYHSQKYKKLKNPIVSQKYNFYLVRQAIKRKAMIIIMRSKKKWINSVPELKNYPYDTLKNPRNVTISRRNLPNSFDKLVRRINFR